MILGLVMTFRYNTKDIIDEIITWALLKLKTSALAKLLAKNEKTSHRLQESTCKKHS